MDDKQKEFLDLVSSKYAEKGLDEEKLLVLLNLKYHAIANAEQVLGDVSQHRSVFINMQEGLYREFSAA